MGKTYKEFRLFSVRSVPSGIKARVSRLLCVRALQLPVDFHCLQRCPFRLMVELVIDIVVDAELLVSYGRSLTHRPLEQASLVLVEIDDVVLDYGKICARIVRQYHVFLPEVLTLDAPADLTWDACCLIDDGWSHVNRTLLRGKLLREEAFEGWLIDA